MSGAARRRGCITAVAMLATAAPLHGQRRIEVGLELGAATVEYDGFLSSGAASVTPTLHLTTPRTQLDARASSLFFQSGRSTTSGDVSGSWLVASGARGLRLRLESSAGASQYATSYRYLFALGGARLSAERASSAIWLAARGGASRTSAPVDAADNLTMHARSAGAVEARGGAAVRLRAVELRGELRGERAGPERLADATLSGAWPVGRLTLDALAGARRARIDAAHAFAEGGAAYRLNDRVALALHAGRYASDPIQGVVAGRFAELTARFALGGTERRRRDPAMVAFTRLGFDVRPAADGGRELRVHVPGASRVEIMADFTNWEPVALRAEGDGRWVLTTLVPAGVHRVNVRIDGGAWTVPPGLTAVADEFGGAVGLLIVE